MTCKIERLASGENTVVLRVSGRIQSEHLGTITELVGQQIGGVALDLTQVTLVDRDVVSFLAAYELKGIELRNCPAFLRGWVAKEQARMAAEPPNTASGANNDVEDG